MQYILKPRNYTSINYTDDHLNAFVFKNKGVAGSPPAFSGGEGTTYNDPANKRIFRCQTLKI